MLLYFVLFNLRFLLGPQRLKYYKNGKIYLNCKSSIILQGE